MATKRSHNEAELDNIHPDRVRGELASAKKRKPNVPATAKSHKHKAKEGSLEYAKKRKRAIERLFQRDTDLPQDVRNDMERELAAHKATIEDKTFHKRRSAMISKYHMVRFFGTSRRLAWTLR
jgi:rRNA-processing protein Efg1